MCALRLRSVQLAESDKDYRAEFQALAALDREDVDLGFPGIIGPFAVALRHQQMGDAKGLKLMGDAFPVVRLHADHGDVAESS